MRSGTSAAWAGGSGALALVALPLFLFAGIGGDAATAGAGCAPAAAAGPAQPAGPDSASSGPHIDLPLAQADARPPVPPQTLHSASWTYPVPAPATVTARFGQDGPNWSKRHTGTDFAPPAGTPVFAATDGVVLAVVPESAGHAFGRYVTVLHADNVVTVYAHLSKALPARGQHLNAGDRIGAVGATGNTTGPHLHFEVRPQIGGRHLPVDPEPYLTAAALPAAGPAVAAASAADCLPLAGRAGTSSSLPDLARKMTPTIQRQLTGCPELPLEWVYAQVMAESRWKPGAWSADSNGGAGGLYQLSRPVWKAVEGTAGTWSQGSKPPSGHAVWEPAVHLRVGITYTCGNLRKMTAYLTRHPGKRISALDAMAVCHVAGCGRVTWSATGMPTPGEAGCGQQCVTTIRTYLTNIHRYLRAYTGVSGQKS
ncbi:hypothetical protein DVA86_20360 [Streptomyces armeniacus]|uniref:M23ase beta-sheet core domain-containing protein n=1 Tax=Streptomyces armeniacus TaxID=83291 RepID=A0A345XSN3_9ACTN|nr:M23 family metallopeptidase [Streptomyces armeniacus]AXK34649.1 hypothetical protein DVA86_20360 [Streptomyces armeniacus]